MESKVLKVEDLTLQFPTARGTAKVLQGVSFDIVRGESFGLVGETGCGKSVTAKTILGLIDRPPAKIVRGKVWYSISTSPTTRPTWRNLLIADETELTRIRGNAISMISQDPMTSLNPLMKVGDQVAEPFLIHRRRDLVESVLRRIVTTIERSVRGDPSRKRASPTSPTCSRCDRPLLVNVPFCRNCDTYVEPFFFARIHRLRLALFHRMLRRNAERESRLFRLLRRIPLLDYERLLSEEARARAVDLIRAVRIPDPDRTAARYPFELSGGMQQRISICMALACRPLLLVADEPTTALDVTIQAQILDLITELKEAMGMSVLLITHNLGLVAGYCSRVAVMYAGSIAEIADTWSIFERPLHPYTQGLIGAIPIPGQNKDELNVIPGRIPDLVNPPSGCRFRTRCAFAFDRCANEEPKLQEAEPKHWVACHLYTSEGRHG